MGAITDKIVETARAEFEAKQAKAREDFEASLDGSMFDKVSAAIATLEAEIKSMEDEIELKNMELADANEELKTLKEEEAEEETVEEDETEEANLPTV